MLYCISFIFCVLFMLVADYRMSRFIIKTKSYVEIPAIAEVLTKRHGKPFRVFVDSTEPNIKNAFHGGIFTRYIVMTLGLFHDEAEQRTDAVLTHECGHAVKRHPLQRLLIIAAIGAGILTGSYYYPFVALFLLCCALVGYHDLRRIVGQICERLYIYQEYEADRYAANMGYIKPLICFLAEGNKNDQAIRRIQKMIAHAEERL